jgi:hypothetical protein
VFSEEYLINLRVSGPKLKRCRFQAAGINSFAKPARQVSMQTMAREMGVVRKNQIGSKCGLFSQGYS